MFYFAQIGVTSASITLQTENYSFFVFPGSSLAISFSDNVVIFESSALKYHKDFEYPLEGENP